MAPLRLNARLLGALLLLGSNALATSFTERPFPETVRETPNIVRGKVGKSQVEWATLPDGSKHLFTFTEIEVSEGFKGKARGGTIRMRELGGTKDGVGLNISGAAQFTAGEDVVVMLNDAVEEGVYPLAGMMMGRYSVERSSEGKEVLRGPGLGSAVHPSLRKAGSNELPLEDLREIVRSQAEEAARPKPSAAPAATGGDGLLGSKGEPRRPPGLEAVDTPVTEKKPDSGPLRGIYFVIGIGVGVAWFLKSRRKRR